MSPRTRAAAFAIAEGLCPIRCRPLCGLGSLFVTRPGARAPGFTLSCATRTVGQSNM